MTVVEGSWPRFRATPVEVPGLDSEPPLSRIRTGEEGEGEEGEEDEQVKEEKKEEEEEVPRALRARAAVQAAREAGDIRTDEQVFLDVLLGPGWDKQH